MTPGVDITDEVSVRRFFDQMTQDGHELHSLYHAAGVSNIKRIHEMGCGQFDAVMASSSLELWHCTKPPKIDPLKAFGVVFVDRFHFRVPEGAALQRANHFLDSLCRFPASSAQAARSGYELGPLGEGVRQLLMRKEAEQRGLRLLTAGKASDLCESWLLNRRVQRGRPPDSGCQSGLGTV